MSKNWTTAVCAAVLALALPPATAAQTNEPAPAEVRRPYRGIFGGASNPNAPQSLTFSASVFGAYDDNVLAGLAEGQVRNSWLQRSGTYWGTSAGLDYTLSKPGERFSFGLSSSAQAQYRDSGEGQVNPYYSGSAYMNARITRSTTLGLRQSLSYAPNYAVLLSPIDSDDFGHEIALPADPDLELFPLQTLRTASSVTLSQQFGRNTTLSGSYNFRTIETEEQEDPDQAQQSRLRDYSAHTATLNFLHTRRMTSHAQLVLGYGVRMSDSGGGNGQPPMMHNVNAGVNYSRALSFSRRTSLSFGTGSAVVMSDNLQDPLRPSRTRVRLLANANLVHEMGRTWTAELAYVRGLQSRDGFGELYFSDAVSTTVQGLVSRRLSVSSSAAWSVSTLDRPGRGGHNSLSASAQATYALTPYLGLYTRYVYYQYDYGDDIPLDTRFARALDRQGVRVGLTTSIPLIR